MELSGPVHFIPFADIKIDEARQRKLIAPGPLQELMRSIEQHGLLHPAVLADGQLVSGRRRMLAMEMLHKANTPVFFGDFPIPHNTMPAVNKQDLDVATQREIELDENIKRVDLTWQERAGALADLHKLRVGQNPEQTVTTTAKEIAAVTGANPARTRETVQQSLLIQPYLADPDIKRAQSFTAAHRLVVNKLEAEFAQSRKHKGVAGLTLVHSAMQDYLQQALPDQFDCVLADPPYGMAADEFGTAAATAHNYADDSTAAIQFVVDLLEFGNHTFKPDCHMYLFCDIELFIFFREMVKERGWNVWRTPLVWHKPGPGHAPDPRRGPRRNYELCLYAHRGQRHLREVRSDVIPVPGESKKLHAAQKPVALYTELLSRSCTVGDHVLDPCAGSGTIFAAAHALNIKATGVEVDGTYHAMAAQRLADLGNGGARSTAEL